MIGVPRRREKGPEKIFEEVIAETSFTWESRQLSLEAQRAPVGINPRRNTWIHIVIKLAKIKDKDKILKATRGK